jgi:hypothetical protein
MGDTDRAIGDYDRASSSIRKIRVRSSIAASLSAKKAIPKRPSPISARRSDSILRTA